MGRNSHPPMCPKACYHLPVTKEDEEKDMTSFAPYGTELRANQIEPGTDPELLTEDVALCFSGGGIRSAAFGRGAFVYLLKTGINIKQLYCISGGGYLGSSFVQNVYEYMEKGASYEDAVNQWIKEKRMENHPNFCCNCKNPFTAIIDILLFVVAVVASIMMVFLTHLPLFFFGAVLVDSIWGNQYRSNPYTVWRSICGIAAFVWTSWIIWNFTKGSKKDHTVRIGNFIVVLSSFAGVLGLQLMILVLELADGTRHAAYALSYSSLLIVIIIAKLFSGLIPAKSLGILSSMIWALLLSLVSWWRISRTGEDIFKFALGISAIVWLIPFGLLLQTWLHTFYRWRLQSAYYLNAGLFGLAGIISNKLTCGGRISKLKDFKKYADKIPTYSGVVSVNGWKHMASWPLVSQTMTLNAGGTCRLLNSKIDLEFGSYQLSSAMATSGAAVSIQMGGFDNKTYRFWQSQLGLGMGNWIDFERTSGTLRILLIVLSQFPFSFISALVVFNVCSPLYMIIPFACFILMVSVSTIFPPDKWWVRWLFWLPIVFAMYQFLNLFIIGGAERPPQMYLADGNFADNLGLFPAIRERRKRIILCDGSEDHLETSHDLLRSINIVRNYSHVSFIPINADGENDHTRDIEETIEIFRSERSNPLLRIRVIFEPVEGDGPKEGIIYYIKPRKMFADKTMGTKNTKNLHGIFCKVCHTAGCEFSKGFCFEFPHHNTANQFFTTEMFQTYEELGFRTAQHVFGKVLPLNENKGRSRGDFPSGQVMEV